MSDEEKATEIAMCLFPMHETADAESIRFGALQMAEWKNRTIFKVLALIKQSDDPRKCAGAWLSLLREVYQNPTPNTRHQKATK
jgi:hypothetical protein